MVYPDLPSTEFIFHGIIDVPSLTLTEVSNLVLPPFEVSRMSAVAQWSANLSLKPLTFTFILLWAHVKGIPFDLYTQEGLGRVIDLLGFSVEVDNFTIRMVNSNVAHLKIRAYCTKPLPFTAEIERENGEIVTISVE
ncbi:hypothetical protein N665_0383s0098 [Sinapis alba]|nr:hypothetical protein N665_0383s0098 [Sinapis alba]